MRAFAFEDRDTVAHRLDPRLKLAALVVFSIAAIAIGPWTGRAVLAAGLLTACAAARINPLKALLAARLFLILAVLVVFGHSFEGGRLSAAGAEAGASVAAGFLLVVLAAELILRTTPAARVTDVIHWALRPVPGVNAGRVALMAGLALRHAVVLGDTYSRVREAFAARGITVRSRPVHNTGVLALALVRETLLQAGLTADALAARGYRDDRTPPAFSPSRADAAAAALVTLVLAAAATAHAVSSAVG
jgi:energy-coupling factor transporter transmembrane protein EcfT